MFTNNLLRAVLLASTVYAQEGTEENTTPTTQTEQSEETDSLELGLVDPSLQDEKYPLIAAVFADGGEYSDYTWEAHRVKTADGYIKTLFHITGNTKSPNFKPKRQPVLFVNGASTNAMSTFDIWELFRFSKTRGDALV